MTDTATQQLRRVLALIPELADDEAHLIETLVDRLGVSRAMLLADLRALTERYDDPAGFVNEGIALFVEHDRVSLTSSHFRRPMRLTTGELHALELGLTMLEAECPPEECRATERARARLGAVVAKLPRDEGADALRHATLGASGSAGHLRVLRDALRARRKVRIAYRRGGSEAATPRVVCPYALVVASGMWYAVALCEEAVGVRVFRLDRVESAESLEDGYAVPATFSVADVVRKGRVLHGDASRTMTVRYSPRIARWIAEREGRALDGDGSLTVEHPLLDVDWGVRHVLQYGPDAEVLSPSAVREELVRRLEGMNASSVRPPS
jgi:predicted DNA-binding transcriptional regulator YafY